MIPRTALPRLSLLLLVGCPALARAGDEFALPRGASAGGEQGDFRGEVVGVADGDTITVLREKASVKLRLQAIDCPEKDQPYGARAKLLTSELAFGKTVTVKVATRDQYGRLVAWVYLPGGKCLNEELLRAGLAWHYVHYDKSKQLAGLEAAARAARRGLWADASPTPPWDHRHAKRPRHGAPTPTPTPTPPPTSAPPTTPAPSSPERCERDDDCAFLPSICHRCAPCTPTARPVGSRREAERIESLRRRSRCASSPCPPCASEANWRGSRALCRSHRCTSDAQLATAASPGGATAPGGKPAAIGPLHGNVKAKVFHRPGCRDYACKHCTATFATAAEALAAGYRACGSCKPR